MTPANKKRLEVIAASVKAVSASKQDAQAVALCVIAEINALQTVLTDLILRPEVNS